MPPPNYKTFSFPDWLAAEIDQLEKDVARKGIDALPKHLIADQMRDKRMGPTMIVSLAIKCLRTSLAKEG